MGVFEVFLAPSLDVQKLRRQRISCPKPWRELGAQLGSAMPVTKIMGEQLQLPFGVRWTCHPFNMDVF